MIWLRRTEARRLLPPSRTVFRPAEVRLSRLVEQFFLRPTNQTDETFLGG